MDTDDGRVSSLGVTLRFGPLDKQFPKARPVRRAVFGERIRELTVPHVPELAGCAMITSPKPTYQDSSNKPKHAVAQKSTLLLLDLSV